MLDKYNDAQESIKSAKVKIHFNKAHSPSAPTENPGDVIRATEGALEDLKEILEYFKDNFLDENGNLIKISFWKWVFKKQYRDKIGGMIDFVFVKIKKIASRFTD